MEMPVPTMLRFLLELVPSLLIGFWAGGRHETLSSRLASPLVRFGVPISVMGLLLKGGLSSEMLQAAGLAVLAMGLVLVGASRLPGLGELASPTLRLGSCTGNTAYFGVPLGLAFLPNEALSISIGYDLGATLLTWSLGPLLIGVQASGSQRLNGLLKSVAASPATRGLLGALLVQATPWSSLVTNVLWWPSRLVILLALMVVGMRLGSIYRKGITPAAQPSRLLKPLVAKLLLYPLLLLLLAGVLRFDSLMMQAIALQGAAPTAISLLLIAESVGADQERAAGLVFWSTLLALLTAPVWGLVLRSQF